MARIFRWLIRGITGAFLLVAAVIALLYWFASRSIPDYTARLSVDGLTGPTERRAV